MALEIDAFPIPLTDALIAGLHKEMQAKVRAELAEEMPGLSEKDITDVVEQEIGRGFDIHECRAYMKKTYIRELYVAAMLLTQPYAPDSYREFAPDVRAWLRRAGQAIYAEGGIPLMQNATYAVRDQLRHAIPLSRAWDGIGSWKH